MPLLLVLVFNCPVYTYCTVYTVYIQSIFVNLIGTCIWYTLARTLTAVEYSAKYNNIHSAKYGSFLMAWGEFFFWCIRTWSCQLKMRYLRIIKPVYSNSRIWCIEYPRVALPCTLYSPTFEAGVYLINLLIKNPASNPAVQSFCSM